MVSCSKQAPDFTSLPTELQLLIVEQYVLGQRTNSLHENSYVDALQCNLRAAVAHAGSPSSNSSSSRALVHQKTSRCEPLLLTCKKLHDLFQAAARMLAPVAVSLDLLDLMEPDPTSIMKAWSQVFDTQRICRVRFEISAQEFSRAADWNQNGFPSAYKPPMKRLSLLLSCLPGVSDLELVFLLPEHGRIYALDQATQCMFSHCLHDVPQGFPNIRLVKVSVARVCFRKGGLDIKSAIMKSRTPDGVIHSHSLDPNVMDCKDVYSNGVPRARREYCRISSELLRPFPTWEENAAIVPTSDASERCRCW